MKYYSIVLLSGMLFLAASCKQDAAEGTGTVTINDPVFYFRGTLGGERVSVEAGVNGIHAVKPILSTQEHRPGNTSGMSSDELAFKTGAILERGLPSIYYLMLFFSLPTADSLRTGMYPIAVFNPTATNVYSQGKMALRIYDQQSGSDYVSYSERNTDLTGQFVEITKIEPYTEPGKTGKKVSYRLNLKLFNFRQFGTVFLGSKILAGDGVALFVQ